ncbi:MAG: type II toxin-antitoxin system HicA family toxin [Nitrospinae bacterium]|nr:type II toxin-antitoxin system HicA family toxin [Nitrospinota bacterium]
MSDKKLFLRISRGSLANIRFEQMTKLAEAFGFRLSRINGSHHIFVHPDAAQILNLQNVNGAAKPYQVKQFLKLVETHNLKMKGRSS